MLNLSHVSKFYDKKIAVNDLSLDVSAGEIYGMLGPNGAGKTSTIRMICAITLPDKGTVTFLGKPMNYDLQNRIGYLPEERGLYKKMTVGNSLLYFAELKGVPEKAAKEKMAYWMNRFEINTWRDKKIQELSKGMQQKVQFISVILHEPELLILDEPFSGLDPINSDLIMDVITELKVAGKTILFSTHRMEQVEKLCDSICLINNGQKVLDGKVRDIKKSYGRNTLLLEFDQADTVLDELQQKGHIKISERSPKSAEIKLTDGMSTKALLTHLNERMDITKFELAEPSLKDIFIMRVGETNKSETNKN
jgi:ABC-2 type transport system ATP-binding protein